MVYASWDSSLRVCVVMAVSFLVHIPLRLRSRLAAVLEFRSCPFSRADGCFCACAVLQRCFPLPLQGRLSPADGLHQLLGTWECVPIPHFGRCLVCFFCGFFQTAVHTSRASLLQPGEPAPFRLLRWDVDDAGAI